LSSSAATVATGGSQTLSANGYDAYGNPVSVADVIWSVSPASLGAVFPAAGPSTTFTASQNPGRATLIATAGNIQASAPVDVSATAPEAPTNPAALSANVEPP
jgi:hypothetical protein